MIRPVLAEIAGSWPSPLSLAQMSAVRRSCQTMARCTAVPVARSHTTVVSRWLVMPIAAMSLALTFGLLQRLAAGRYRRGPDVLRLVLDPARGRKMLREFGLRAWRRSRCRRETRWRARMWCPDRWPAQRTLALLPGWCGLLRERQADWGLVGQYRRCPGPHRCRPCESRDPYAAALHVFAGVSCLRANEDRWLWVPAFAGTTCGGARPSPLPLRERVAAMQSIADG